MESLTVSPPSTTNTSPLGSFQVPARRLAHHSSSGVNVTTTNSRPIAANILDTKRAAVFTSLRQKMQNDAAPVGALPMFKQVDALPCTQCQFPIAHRNRKLCLRERGANVGRHVVRPFRGVA